MIEHPAKLKENIPKMRNLLASSLPLQEVPEALSAQFTAYLQKNLLEMPDVKLDANNVFRSFSVLLFSTEEQFKDVRLALLKMLSAAEN